LVVNPPKFKEERGDVGQRELPVPKKALRPFTYTWKAQPTKTHTDRLREKETRWHK
jgi:hypothetical protein